MKNGIGSHQSQKMKNDEWLTPPEIMNAFPVFDLDPCAPIVQPWKTAKKKFSILDNGLLKEWNGRVWCNPPYGKDTSKWLERMKIHNDGIALIFARTETKMFFDHVWNGATSLLFIKGRLHFHYVDGTRAKANSGAPSVLIAYGEESSKILEDSKIEGQFVMLKS